MASPAGLRFRLASDALSRWHDGSYGRGWRWGHPHFAGPVSGWPLPFAGQAFQPDGLTSKAGQFLTGVVTALLSAATPREMAEESRFLVLSIAPGIFS